MKKGTVVGGQANGEASAKAPRGMLPPTGNGPIEVTRETLGSTAVLPAPKTDDKVQPEVAVRPGSNSPLQVASLVPPEVAASLEAELPAASEDLRTVITACEKRLHAAGMLHEAMKKKALTTYFYFAGPAVRLAHASESWRETVDPATGKRCRSWSAWLRSVKVSRQHAERMTKEEPLMEALKGLDVKQLNTAQIDALAPVLNRSGASEVRRLWTAAVGWGDTSGPSLMRLRAQLGLESGKEISEGEEESTSSAPDLPILRFQTKAGTFDANQVRTVARHQPEIARLVARTILDELGDEDPTEE
jgi:hypothetical protein